MLCQNLYGMVFIRFLVLQQGKASHEFHHLKIGSMEYHMYAISDVARICASLNVSHNSLKLIEDFFTHVVSEFSCIKIRTMTTWT